MFKKRANSIKFILCVLVMIVLFSYFVNAFDPFLVAPANNTIVTYNPFNLVITTDNISSSNCTLWWNVSGTWEANQSVSHMANAYTNIVVNVSNGTYVWNVICYDDPPEGAGDYTWANNGINWTFTVTDIEPARFLMVDLLYPQGGNLNTSNFDFSVNVTTESDVGLQANCTIFNSLSGNWTVMGNILTGSDGIGNFTNNVANPPDGPKKWNAACFNTTNPSINGMSNFNASFNIGIGEGGDFFGCGSETNKSGCALVGNCTWYFDSCIADCKQFNSAGQSTCENAFGGGLCTWDSIGQGSCESDMFNDSHFGGDASPCFDYDGNKTGCDSFSNECSWFSEPSCPAQDECYV